MLQPKYHNYIFYVHNLGGFDVLFIHKILKEYNLINNKEYYILKSIYRDDIIIKLSISIKINKNKYIKINLVDSLNILNSSLDSLSKSFKVKIKKSIFPYTFVKKENLNYIGETPNIKYYNKLSELEYKEIYSKDDWDLRQESLIYLERDLISLLEVLDKFNKSLFINHGIQMTECLTISRIALTKFLRYYLKDKKIPLINKLQYFNFLISDIMEV